MPCDVSLRFHLPRAFSASAAAWLTAAGLGLLVGCAGDSSETTPSERTATAPADRAPSSASRPAPGAAEAPSTGDGPPLFVELSEESGLVFRHRNGMIGERYFHEMMGAGAAWLDYDGDGDLDLYLVQGHALDGSPPQATDRLFRNDLERAAAGDARLAFTDVTEESGIRARGYGMGAAVGDVDGDGWPDLYVTNFGPNQLWRNRGDGTFEDWTARSRTGDPAWSVPALFFDADRDGDLDLFVGNYVDYSIATNKRCTTDLGELNYCGPLAYRPQADSFYRNRGDGTFDEVARRVLGQNQDEEIGLGGALGALTGDFDGDGWPDLYVANDGLPNHLYLNNGDGTFRDEALYSGAAVNADGSPEASMGIDAADLDGDGDEDLFMTHLSQETNTLYRNLGGGLFEDESVRSGLAAPSWEATGFGTAFLDLENDGDLDLIAVNGAVRVIDALARAGDPFPLHQGNQLFRQDRGAFTEITAAAGAAFAPSEVSRGVAVADADDDGDLDVLITNHDGPARLLINRAADGAPWIGLRLVERPWSPGGPPADVVGAWVGLEISPERTVWRRTRRAGSYASSRDPRLVFGLGDASPDGPLAAVVTWPDGRRERFAGLAIGAYATLVAGEGASVAGER